MFYSSFSLPRSVLFFAVFTVGFISNLSRVPQRVEDVVDWEMVVYKYLVAQGKEEEWQALSGHRTKTGGPDADYSSRDDR